MNPKTLKIKTRECELCDFNTSEFHHFFPETRGGERTGSKSGIYLCPNHHHMANILQIQIENFTRSGHRMPDELSPADFAHLAPFFDEAFKKIIPILLMGYDVGRREYLISAGVYE